MQANFCRIDYARVVSGFSGQDMKFALKVGDNGLDTDFGLGAVHMEMVNLYPCSVNRISLKVALPKA